MLAAPIILLTCNILPVTLRVDDEQTKPDD